MKRRPHILIVIVFFISELYGQPGKLVRTEVLSTNEGLGHRITLDIDSDTEGQYFINSPLGLQLYSKGEINATAQVASLNIHQSMIRSDGHLSILDIDNCVHVINKNNFEQKSKYCISDFISGNITLVKLRQNKLLVLSKTSEQDYTLHHIEPSLSAFKTRLTIPFKSISEVIDVHLNQENEISFIDSNEVFYHLGKSTNIFNPEISSGSLKMEPKIFENTKDGKIYFSFHSKPGVYCLTGNKVDSLQGGFIHTYNEDQQGDVIIGVTEATINFISNLLYIEQQQEPILWNELIESNDKALDFHSTDFSHEITIASYVGIYHYSINPMHLESFLAEEEIEPGDFGKVIRCIGIGHDNEIKAVKESGRVLYKISYDSASIDQDLLNLRNYGTNWFEYNKADSSYYVGSYNGDFTSNISKYNLETKKKEELIIPMTIERFFMDDDDFWAIGNQSESGKVLKINRESGYQESLFDNHLLRKDLRSCLLLDDQFLAGTNQGLYIYDRLKNIAVDSTISNTEKLHVTCIRKYGDQFFIGTQNEGLKIFDQHFNLVSEVEIGTTRPSNTIAAIETDTFDNYWISTFDGLTILNKDLLLVEKIDLEDGLSSYEFNRDASYKDKDGTLYFGNLNGYTRINPTLFFANNRRDDYLLGDVTYSIGKDQFLLQPNENSVEVKGIPDNIQLNYFHPGFSIKSTLPNLKRKILSINPKPDSLVIESDNIKLFGLKKGNYEISVIPRYGDQNAQSITHISVSQNYDWLKEVIAISTIIGLISFIISSWIISIIKKESEAKIQLQNELSEIRMKALRSQLNPHFIFNSLNSIQYYIQVNDKRKARDYLSKFARLMRMVLQSSHDDVITIDKEIEQLSIYLELEKLRFEDMWDYEINISEAIDAASTTIPSMLFQPIIENAILHGLSHLKKRKGLLTISIEKYINGIVATIDDNGVGRSKSIAINNKKINKSKSLSTSISKDRIALYNKFESDNISIDYADKYTDNGEAAGTTAIINITTSTNGIYQSNHH